MIRVAHVKGNYGQVGGPETLLEALMPCFAAMPEIEVVTILVGRAADPALEARLSGQGAVRLIRIPWRGLKGVPLAARDLGRLLKAERIDLVHSHDMRCNLMVALLRPFAARRLRWIAHVHGWLGHTHRPLYRLFEATERNLIRRADLIMVGSEKTRAEADAAGLKRLAVVPNAVAIPDEAETRTGRAALGLPDDAVILTVLGRLHPGKGQDLFLRSLARLPPDPRWHGLIVGAGDEAGPLAALAAELDLPGRVTFTGFVPSPAPWIAASDVIVVPSRKESLPLTCLEGMAQGRAVVASRAGDMPRVVEDGRTGLLVDIDDMDGLTDALARLLTAPDLRRRLGAAAREHIVHNHSARVLAGRIAVAQVALVGGA